MLEHEVHHRGDSGGGGDLDRRPQPPGDDLRIDLVDVVFLAQLSILRAGDRRIHDHHVLERLRHGVLEDALERAAIVIELQVVHEQAHLLAVTGVTDGLVVHRLDVRAVGRGQRPEAPRGVEGLIQRAVDLDFLESLERRNLEQPPVAHRLAGIAVLVDESLGGPGEGVLEDVVRVLRQGADAQLHGPQRVEVCDQLGGGDADESGRETTLRHECLLGPRGEGAHRARDVHVFRQVEVVDTRLAGGRGDPEVAVVRQAGNDAIDGVLGEMPRERRRVGRVERKGEDVARLVGTHHRLRRSAVDIAQLNLVTARFG